MKLLLIIIFWLLSQIGHGGGEVPVLRSLSPAHDEINQGLSHIPFEDWSCKDLMCLSSARGVSLSGGDRVQGASVRNLPTGRRAQSNLRGQSRVLRCGKIIDIHNFDPVITTTIVREHGSCSKERYIYSICCLRI